MKLRNKKHTFENEVSNRLSSHTNFHAEEAYKIIRTNLLFTLASAKNNIILVSSPEAAAGKSITCANLAISMAQTGKNVVLIDADMRKPVQHRIFEFANTDGLSTILSKTADADKILHHYKDTSLDVISAGPIPPNPVELLSSKNMQDFLDSISGGYDYVFIDTPPINMLSDALVLEPYVSGTVLIARQNQTTYDSLQKTIDSIKKVNGTVLGVVINDVREKSKPYSSYYYGSYGSCYGSYGDGPSSK
ncbi:CpsD/CapB family tyrosine-protein kinase [Caproicibacterium lactatifermentans]|uniref:non-specific protein-tyrosine kinase n=1 Tax=Caproicibacterium lactatifermentans TaxID=2666138 RepID=A0A859DTW9_9FIRM|nr:CpsD/CapB family tyrosine-protein kinase [Caproicibacterium lactatifermentans]QKN23683.1 polysaccharide biosynthesis tyrosine autokinase [Caproicibacterium lactatifermentans]